MTCSDDNLISVARSRGMTKQCEICKAILCAIMILLTVILRSIYMLVYVLKVAMNTII